MNTWELAPKSPIYCPRSFLPFSDNSFKYPYTIKLTNAFRCFILFFLRQMDGSRFSDPIKIKPRATESLSLPVGNCGEGSIRSKTSSGYYILVIVFLTIPSPFNWCLLLSLFKISKPPLNPLYLIFFPSGNAIRVLDVFTWNWFFPRSFDWDLGLRAEIGCNFIFVIIIFKRHLLLHSLLWREGLICSNWRKIGFF